MWFQEEPSQLSVGQTAQSPTCSIMEKPQLDDCLKILLLCFRARTSVQRERYLGFVFCCCCVWSSLSRPPSAPHSVSCMSDRNKRLALRALDSATRRVSAKCKQREQFQMSDSDTGTALSRGMTAVHACCPGGDQVLETL